LGVNFLSLATTEQLEFSANRCAFIPVSKEVTSLFDALNKFLPPIDCFSKCVSKTAPASFEVQADYYQARNKIMYRSAI